MQDDIKNINLEIKNMGFVGQTRQNMGQNMGFMGYMGYMGFVGFTDFMD